MRKHINGQNYYYSRHVKVCIAFLKRCSKHFLINGLNRSLLQPTRYSYKVVGKTPLLLGVHKHTLKLQFANPMSEQFLNQLRHANITSCLSSNTGVPLGLEMDVISGSEVYHWVALMLTAGSDSVLLDLRDFGVLFLILCPSEGVPTRLFVGDVVILPPLKCGVLALK